MRRLFINGHPSLYGGAGSELWSQMKLWHQSFPEIEIHIIPTMQGVEAEPLRQECLDMGVTYHPCREYSMLTKDDAVINFCSSQFLEDLERIRQHTKRIAWANCMTFLFPAEKLAATKDLISHHLYQRPQIRDAHRISLESLGAKGEFIHFLPYFEPDKVEYSVKDQEKTHIGRISRQDSDKFAKNTLHIYEGIVSPRWKRGHFLGFDHRSEAKIGKAPGWITTYRDQNQLSVKDFWNQIDFVVQATDTTENLPRIGFEAMYSGKPLVVDNRGGWPHMIEHGITGFLCNHERDFIYYGSRLAYDFDLRNEIAVNARNRAIEMSSLKVSTESWKNVFESLYQ